VVHHTDYLVELLRLGRLKLDGRRLERLTFHDSCYLGRWNGIYEAPRQLLSRLTNAGGIIEMRRAKATGFCCGAGGARMFMEETIGKRINHERAEEAIATRAQTLAAACPFCITMLRDGLLDKGSDMQVRDIVELIDEAVS
jgi:Fe-S oxidoreductase